MESRPRRRRRPRRETKASDHDAPTSGHGSAGGPRRLRATEQSSQRASFQRPSCQRASAYVRPGSADERRDGQYQPNAASEATAPASARPTPGEPTPGEPRPPDALLTLPDGTQQAGALGSYFYGGAAADSPWLPAHSLPPLEVASGATLRLTAPPLEFVRWSARYAEAADVDASMITPLAAGGEGSVGMTSATLPAPPSGSWVVSVQLYFADDEGDATYYWHVSVP